MIPGPASLGPLLVGAGLTHLMAPRIYDPVIPPWIPGPARAWTYASGLAELVAGMMLLAPRTRRAGGWAAAAVFVGVYPANLDMAWQRRSRPLALAVCLARLPLQVPLVVGSLRAARHDPRARTGEPLPLSQ